MFGGGDRRHPVFKSNLGMTGGTTSFPGWTIDSFGLLGVFADETHNPHVDSKTKCTSCICRILFFLGRTRDLVISDRADKEVWDEKVTHQVTQATFRSSNEVVWRWGR